jgi:LysR family transcriptional regulator, hydrogen peroxide-inducible genes activator
MNGLTLKHLRYFEALARMGHFGRAADVCAISQPALSMQIKELEAILDAPLFERTPKGLHLTPFGDAFALRARHVLREIDGIADLARSAAGAGLAGRLRLGIIPTIAPYFLPTVMGALQAGFAGLDVHLREAQTQVLLTELDDGRLDAAILALPISAPHIEQTALFTEDFVLVRPMSETGFAVPNAQNLREMRLLLLEEGHCFRDQALAFCAPQPAARAREVMDGSSLTTLVQMVCAGMGVTLIPEMAVPVETRAAEVCIQRFPAPAPQRRIGMVWRKTSPIAGPLAQIASQLTPALRA